MIKVATSVAPLQVDRILAMQSRSPYPIHWNVAIPKRACAKREEASTASRIKYQNGLPPPTLLLPHVFPLLISPSALTILHDKRIVFQPWPPPSRNAHFQPTRPEQSIPQSLASACPVRHPCDVAPIRIKLSCLQGRIHARSFIGLKSDQGLTTRELSFIRRRPRVSMYFLLPFFVDK